MHCTRCGGGRCNDNVFYTPATFNHVSIAHLERMCPLCHALLPKLHGGRSYGRGHLRYSGWWGRGAKHAPGYGQTEVHGHYMCAVRRSRDEITIVHQVVLATVPLEQIGRRVRQMSGKTTLSHQQRYSTKQHRIMTISALCSLCEGCHPRVRS